MDNKTAILKEFEKLKGQFVITGSGEVVRLQETIGFNRTMLGFRKLLITFAQIPFISQIFVLNLQYQN